MTKFTPVPSPFGTDRQDEMATQEAFVEFVGGRFRADMLFEIYKNSYPMPGPWKSYTKEEAFRARAKQRGFNDEEVDALLAIQ